MAHRVLAGEAGGSRRGGGGSGGGGGDGAKGAAGGRGGGGGGRGSPSAPMGGQPGSAPKLGQGGQGAGLTGGMGGANPLLAGQAAMFQGGMPAMYPQQRGGYNPTPQQIAFQAMVQQQQRMGMQGIPAGFAPGFPQSYQMGAQHQGGMPFVAPGGAPPPGVYTGPVPGPVVQGAAIPIVSPSGGIVPPPLPAASGAAAAAAGADAAAAIIMDPDSMKEVTVSEADKKAAEIQAAKQKEELAARAKIDAEKLIASGVLPPAVVAGVPPVAGAGPLVAVAAAAVPAAAVAPKAMAAVAAQLSHNWHTLVTQLLPT
ncbi:hypothetical protein T492DRAFT_1139208 [Pavlovales sp. CCMP2436]|nr:hypothetical protein T492DRAFT_1139208 [Pavlovales sp. CCMP2436]